ncbi:MAG: hypothetical protein AAGF73_14445 [Actinomycetota bacterium]
MVSQADQLSERLNDDAALRQQITVAHRRVLDDAGVSHDGLTDGELAAIVGGVMVSGAIGAKANEAR